MIARATESAVLAIHHVTPGRAWSPLAVSASALRRRLSELKRAGYRFVPLAEVGPEGPPSGAVAVTADDGYSSQVTYLRPLLAELGVPWTVFVLVGTLGSGNGWDVPGVAPRDRHLTSNDVESLARDGVTIGSHGLSHQDWTRLSGAALAEELGRSRERLRELSGQDVDAVAYPWGAVDLRVADAARHAGYRFGFRLGGPGPTGPASLASHWIGRTALYSPDQCGRIFSLTTFGAPRPLRALRATMERTGRTLVGAALRARESLRA
jgi:peptidoglycan/xylan/chitin deacetylase (PgdA/CDA1 family)